MLLLVLLASSSCSWFEDGGPHTEVFTSVEGIELSLDLYVPDLDDGQLAPVLVMVHDGGWRDGSRADWRSIAEDAAAEGWAVVVPDYRLSGESTDPWPGAVRDVQAALAWTAEQAAARGLDVERLAILGGSAGGQLVGILATVGASGDPVAAVAPEGTPAIRAAATWSAPFDLAPLASVEGSEPPGCGDSLLCTRFWQVFPVVTQYLGCTPDACPEDYLAASPVHRVGSDTSPMLIVNATDEPVPLAQARAMADALDAAGVESELLQVPGSTHSRGYAEEVLDDTLRFLRAEVDRAS